MHHLRRGAAGLLLVVLAANAITACASDEPADTSAFCGALRSATALSGPISQLDLDDPDTITTATTELEALASLAPDELRSDVEIVAEVYGEVLVALSTAPPGGRADVLRDLQERLDEVSAPAVRLQDYASDDCGIRFDAPERPTPTPTPVDIED